MATTITVTGQGGVQVSGTTKVSGYQSPAPLELHGDQWGLYRYDIKPRLEDQF